MKYIETVQDLIDLLNTIDDKSKPLTIQAITGQDSNSRNEYKYLFKAEVWGTEITRSNGVKLVLEE